MCVYTVYGHHCVFSAVLEKKCCLQYTNVNVLADTSFLRPMASSCHYVCMEMSCFENVEMHG